MTTVNRYRNRRAAGQVLGGHLHRYADRADALVLALPRGGVPVAAEISRQLHVPLDVFVVRKLGLPGDPEFAMGAIATGGARLLDDSLVAHEHLSPATVAEVVTREAAELERREMLYRGDRPAPMIAGRAVILVDDGVATGYTMRVAVLALRQLHPAELVVAIPVGAPDTCRLLTGAVDNLVCPLQPTPFMAVGLWYDHFPPVSDAEVREDLAHAVVHA